MKTLLLLLFLSPLSLLAQLDENYVLKLGIGGSAIPGDRVEGVSTISAEMYHNLNDWQSISGSFLYGSRADNVSDGYLHLLRADFNYYFSPFGNKKWYNFEVGTGVSVYGSQSKDRTIRSIDPSFRHSVGINLIADNTIKLSEDRYLSFAGFVTSYVDAKAHIGFNLKYGIVL